MPWSLVKLVMQKKKCLEVMRKFLLGESCICPRLPLTESQVKLTCMRSYHIQPEFDFNQQGYHLSSFIFFCLSSLFMLYILDTDVTKENFKWPSFVPLMSDSFIFRMWFSRYTADSEEKYFHRHRIQVTLHNDCDYICK